jgi:hypothetical protein
MGKLNRHLWRKSNISLSTKLWNFNTLVLSVMPCGAETCHASPATLKAINVFQTNSLKRIKGLSWPNVLSNEKLLPPNQSQISTQAAERTLKLFGNLL